MTFSNIITLAAIHCEDDEPRIADLDLAAWLGFKEPRHIRELIARNRAELDAHGIMPCHAAKTGTRGRPAIAYHLNEAQALTLCALSRTSKAAAVRRALVKLFSEYQAGRIVDVRAHKRRMPTRAPSGNGEFYDRVVRPYVDNPDALAHLIMSLSDRIEALEARLEA